MYGREKVEEMLNDKELVKIKTFELIDMLKIYEQKLEELMSKKDSQQKSIKSLAFIAKMIKIVSYMNEYATP